MTTTFIRGIEHFKTREDRNVVATLGTFDGIHLGHQEILCELRDTAYRMKMEPVLITFNPHPKVVVSPNDIPMLLTTIEEKEKFIPDFLEGNVLVLEFNDQLRNMSAEDFVKKILVNVVGVKKLIVGYDHAFGKNRSGSIDELKRLGEKYGFDVQVVPPIIVDGKAVSSSRIRKAMAAGHYSEAVKLLGHEYAIYGIVEKGIGLGRKLGYPTVNVRYSPRKLLPPEGVYSCWAQVGKDDLCGMMFIGQNHFNPQRRVTVEANLFDFDRNIYEQEIILYPCHYVRENRKFDSTDDLAHQIDADKRQIMQLLETKGEKACQ